MDFLHPDLGAQAVNRAEPVHSGTLENNAQMSEPAQPDWVTVNDAQELFRNLGLPRSVEAIRKYCRQGKLEAEVIAGPKGDQHMINRNSIDTFVNDQLKVLQAATRSIPVRDGTSRQIPVHSVTSRVEPAHPGASENQDMSKQMEEMTKKIARLESENRDLAIDKEVRSRMNGVLEQNNNRLIEQIREVSQEAQEWSRKYGQLEERVQHLQLTAPSDAAADTAALPNATRQAPSFDYQQRASDHFGV